MKRQRRRAWGEEERERRERERDREVDEEIESRISSAMCQTAPVGVFTSIQYL